MTDAGKLIARALVAACVLAPAAPAFAQTLEGDWSGMLQTPKAKLHLVLHITRAAEGLPNASLDSPDQGMEGLPGRVIDRKGATAQVLFLDAGADYTATLSADGRTLDGKWNQGPASIPLVMTRNAAAPAKR